MKRSNIWLSIDFDFFVRELEKWDFGHSESFKSQGMLWNLRVASFMAQGKDLLNETSLKHSDPHPRRFWKALQDVGYSFSNVQAIVVGDSHQWGHRVFRRSALDGPPLAETRLVHFDAHHDLTYDITRFEQEAERAQVTCENWLLMTHLSQINLKSLIVYPTWKGLRDWNRSFGSYFKDSPELKEALARYTKPCVWPDPLVKRAAGEVELVYVCRSSAWTPPWHDSTFTEFVFDLSQISKVPVAAPFTQLENVDPLVSRPFDLNHIKRNWPSSFEQKSL